jgi:hypothetical protein
MSLIDSEQERNMVAPGDLPCPLVRGTLVRGTPYVIGSDQTCESAGVNAPGRQKPGRDSDCVVGRAAMSKFSEIMMDHVLSRRNGGVLEQPDLTGRAGTPRRCAFMIMCMRVDKSRIVAAE